MKIFVFTDVHGKIDMFERHDLELGQPDLVLLAGDLTHFGGQNEAKRVLDAVRKCCNHIFAVSGNCDKPEVGTYLEKEGISLHGTVKQFNNLHFLGIGGSLPCPGYTPNEYTEDEIEEILNSAAKDVVTHLPMVLVSHQPPFNTINDAVRQNYHVGSRSIRRFIEKFQPLVCFTGHIHEGIGIDHIGVTKIVNPGPLFTGTYVNARINSKIASLEIKKIPRID